MNQKGFSLIELIAVILIITIISTLSIVTFISIRNNALEQDYNNLVNYLETKATEYANKTGITSISVGDLIKEGMVQPDDEANIYDPRDNRILNCYIIKTRFEDGIYKSKLSEKLEDENGNCKKYSQTSSIKICRLNNDKECVDIEDNEWFKEDVKLSVRYENNKDFPENAIISWTSTSGKTSNEKIILASTNTTSQNTYKVEVITDNIRGFATKKINIDKQNPKIIAGKVDDKWSISKVLMIEATDYSGSGIKGYSFVKENEECINFSEKNTFEYKEEGRYKYCVSDNVGNITSDFVDIVKIDNNVPVKPKITPSDNLTEDKWHKNNFTLSFSSPNEKSKSAITYHYGFSKDNLNVKGSEVKIDVNYNRKTMYVKACNEAGLCSEISSYKVKYDNIAPKYVSGGGIGRDTISKPEYEDNNGGSGNVTVYVCATNIANVANINYNHECFNLGVEYKSNCGTNYILLSYAVDDAGNRSQIYNHHEHDNKINYYRSCSTTSGGGTKSNNKSCDEDVDCRMQKRSEEHNMLQEEKLKGNKTQEEIDAINKRQEELHAANEEDAKLTEKCKPSCNFDPNTGKRTNSETGAIVNPPSNTPKTSSNSNSSSTNTGSGKKISQTTSSTGSTGSTTNKNPVTTIINTIGNILSGLFGRR